MRILIAEDDSILADGLSRSLRHNGYAVDAVRDGLAADSALAAQAFDLLILTSACPIWRAWKCCGACARAIPPCPS